MQLAIGLALIALAAAAIGGALVYRHREPARAAGGDDGGRGARRPAAPAPAPPKALRGAPPAHLGDAIAAIRAGRQAPSAPGAPIPGGERAPVVEALDAPGASRLDPTGEGPRSAAAAAAGSAPAGALALPAGALAEPAAALADEAARRAASVARSERRNALRASVLAADLGLSASEAEAARLAFDEGLRARVALYEGLDPAAPDAERIAIGLAAIRATLDARLSALLGPGRFAAYERMEEEGRFVLPDEVKRPAR